MAKMQNIKRLIKEQGMICSKEHKESRDEFVNFEGKTISGSPEKYILIVVSGQGFNEKTGYSSPLFKEYTVAKEVYDKVNFADNVNVVFEMSNYGIKELGIELK